MLESKLFWFFSSYFTGFKKIVLGKIIILPFCNFLLSKVTMWSKKAIKNQKEEVFVPGTLQVAAIFVTILVKKD